MKFIISTEFLIVVFLFLSVMIISSYGSTRIMPFEAKSSNLHMFPYRDGFSDYNVSNENLISNPTNMETLTTIKQPLSDSILNVKPNQLAEIPERTTKFSLGEYGEERMMDVVSQLPSSPSCENISAGLSNSKGYLCTTKEVDKLYKTRGGNASGQPSQIGA